MCLQNTKKIKKIMQGYTLIYNTYIKAKCGKICIKVPGMMLFLIRKK